MYAPSRPVLENTTACICDEGWEGPNCNICQSSRSCSALPSSSLGSQNVCNQSPVVWGNRHFSSCNVNNNLIKLAYRQPSTVTVERNAIEGSVLATIWLANDPQFSCKATQCTQSFDNSKSESLYINPPRHDLDYMGLLSNKVYLSSRQ